MQILRHTALNLIGLGAPLLVAFFTIPLLISTLGTSRFGLLTLIWAVVSYFGLFDLGLGRALTQQLSIEFAHARREKVGDLVLTSLGVMLLLGGVIALAMEFVVAEFIVASMDDIPADEARGAVSAMSAAMPFILLTSGLRGILEARFAFGILNAIRIPLGIFTFAGPLAASLLISPDLVVVSWTLALGRAVACIVHGWFAVRSIGFEPRRSKWDSALLTPLLSSGGWMTVSNIISPFMGYVDRFVIGSTLSLAAVAYYATPNEIITKVWIIPAALTAVLFPHFSTMAATGGAKLRESATRSLYWLYVAVLPVTLTIALFAKEILGAWIDADFAANSYRVLQILALGMYVNCFAHVPFTLLQSGGHSRITALIHMVELPVFAVVLWLLTSEYGIEGAAWSWLGRIVVDTALLFHFSSKYSRNGAGTLTWREYGIGVAGCLLFVSALSGSVAVRVISLAAGLIAAASLILLERGGLLPARVTDEK